MKLVLEFVCISIHCPDNIKIHQKLGLSIWSIQFGVPVFFGWFNVLYPQAPHSTYFEFFIIHVLWVDLYGITQKDQTGSTYLQIFESDFPNLESIGLEFPTRIHVVYFHTRTMYETPLQHAPAAQALRPRRGRLLWGSLARCNGFGYNVGPPFDSHIGLWLQFF